MKKRFAILFAITILLLSACSKQTDNHETEPSTTHSKIEVKDYPGDSAIATFGFEYPLSAELFDTSAEENGKEGVLYEIYGTVEEYVQYEAQGLAHWKISTHHGDVIVQDTMYYFEHDSEHNYSTTELERMRVYYPIPEIGEFIHIYAEYQDTKEIYGGPLFSYGGRDYFVKVVMATVDHPEGDTSEQETTVPAEKPSGSGSTTGQQPSGNTEPPPATEEATTTPTVAPQTTEPPATQPEETTPPVTSPVETESAGNSTKAVDRANAYLRITPMSRAGIIRQLEHEGFSNEEAAYGADHCGADWNEQSVRKAKRYLDSYFFSYSGLIHQLEYEGFTNGEAVYGADNSGADWYEQAKKGAATYLANMSFTREALIHQLEYSGFTHDQAVYGVEANGL